jgi:glycosyltransferase involved in cell wall biosynthesis
MKICVITPNYTIAGVPLAQLRFARALAARGHDVDLIIGYIDPQYIFPEVSDIRLIHMNQQQVRGMFLPLISYLKKNKPDIIFSAEDHLNSVVLLAALIANSKAKISCSSRVTPFDTYSNIPFTKRWILKQFMRLIMSRADALTCVSQDMVEQYRQVFKSPPHVNVYNIVDYQESQQKMLEPINEDWLLNKCEPVIIAAGRLAPWKGFSDLIVAMGKLTKTKKVKLIILGDGPSRAELEALIAKLHLGNTVKLLGYVDNPLKYFKHADVFVLSSLVEGLPNVLVEAMMCGCTPVSTDCPTGPREVLQEGKYGYLVPVQNPIALAEGIIKALDNPISSAILNEAIRPFAAQVVIDRHFEVLGINQLKSVKTN